MWNICRTCMSKEEELISIFDQSKSPPINAMIMAITSLEVLPNDALPSQICVTCFETIEITYYFKEKAIRCNNTLQKQAETLRLLAPEEVKEERCENEYVTIVDFDHDIATENVACNVDDPASKCPVPLISVEEAICDNDPLYIELSSSRQAYTDDLHGGDSANIKGGHSRFEVVNIKSEQVDIEEHGVQHEDDCEILQPRVKSEIENAVTATDDIHTGKVSSGLKELEDVDGDKPFKCTHCNKVFKRKSTLTTHVYRHTHSYKCEVCGNPFSTASQLKIHMRMHTGERPFQCQHCNATFNQPGNLKRHIRTHTGEATPKPFKCELCEKTFEKPSRLELHMRGHTGDRPYKCQFCNATFKHNDHRNGHMRVHTGEAKRKPHICEVCNKAFEAPSHLKIHMAVHTGERPFKCQHCSASFKRLSHLKDHVEICKHANSQSNQNSGNANIQG